MYSGRLEIPIRSGADWSRMRRVLKFASGIFVEGQDKYSEYFAECGWVLNDSARFELIAEVEKYRVDGMLPSNPFFSPEHCSHLNRAMGFSGDSVLSVYAEEGTCDIEPAPPVTDVWGRPTWTDNMVGWVSPTERTVKLQKDLLFSVAVALIAYSAFLDDGPSAYAGLASTTLSGALWLLLEYSYDEKRKERMSIAYQEERNWTRDASASIRELYEVNAAESGAQVQYLKEVSSLFDEQKKLSERMRGRLEEQRILRSSSGGMLI